MGDRCYMHMTVRKDDEKLWAEIEEVFGGQDAYKEEGNSITLGFDEVNYGAFTERNVLAAKGFVFYGYHGSGGDYGAYEFAAYGGNMIDVPVLQGGGDYVVRFNPKTGKVVKGEIVKIKEFLKLKKKAKSYIERWVK